MLDNQNGLSETSRSTCISHKNKKKLLKIFFYHHTVLTAILHLPLVETTLVLHIWQLRRNIDQFDWPCTTMQQNNANG